MKNLTRTELERAGREAAAAARKDAFAAGTYFCLSKDGRFLREYPDGKIIEHIPIVISMVVHRMMMHRMHIDEHIRCYC